MNKQSQHSIFVRSFSITIQLLITGSDEFVASLAMHPFWREFVPGFSLEHAEASQQWHITEGLHGSYNLKSHTITAPAESIASIIVIIEAEFEKLRQEQGIYTMHGSYIGRDDVAVGFIGAISGLGKTTLCAHAATQGWRWLGDEKFSFTEDRAVAGGGESILRDTKTHHASGQLRPTPDTTPRSLRLLCIPLVTGETAATVHSLDFSRRAWQHYDEITRDIRQINGVINGFSTPLPSRDIIMLSKKRQKTALSLAHSLPIVHVRGTKQAILETIETLI